MTWQDEIVPLVRALIDDYDNPFTYLDNKLEDYIIFSAHLLRSLPFSNTYTVSISGCSITPDPSADYAFINLVAMQAACLIFQSEVQTYTRQGVIVDDGFGGRTKIDTKPRLDAAIANLDKFKKAFEKAKAEHIMGEGVVGHAVMTPRTLEYYWI